MTYGQNENVGTPSSHLNTLSFGYDEFCSN
jgi:hypothetical protein